MVGKALALAAVVTSSSGVMSGNQQHYRPTIECENQRNNFVHDTMTAPSQSFWMLFQREEKRE